jgi:hypothetical protein
MDDIDDSDDENMPSWLAENERQRLWHGPGADEPESELFTMDRIEVTSAGDADAVLAHVRETLDVALAQSPDNWPSTDAWLKLLPSWFVAQCRKEYEPPPMHPLVAQLYSLPTNQWVPFYQEHRDEWPPKPPSHPNPRWTVSAFVYWFLPDKRQWWWWNVEVQDADHLAIETAPFDSPYAWGALEWLLYAAGALHSESPYNFGPELPDRRSTQ